MYVDTQSLVRQSWCRPGRQPISRPERRDLKVELSSDHANTTHHSDQSDHVNRASPDLSDRGTDVACSLDFFGATGSFRSAASPRSTGCLSWQRERPKYLGRSKPRTDRFPSNGGASGFPVALTSEAARPCALIASWHLSPSPGVATVTPHAAAHPCGGAGLTGSMPIVSGNSPASSSSVQRPSL